jgi:putative heme-binding domain-containing protein
MVASLVEAIESDAISPAELDASARDALRRLPDEALRRRAVSKLDAFAPVDRSDVVARYRSALSLPGDPQRGEAVFARNCQTCHRRNGQGNRVGPDLSGIAGRAPEALLNDILDPNKDVAPDFVSVTVVTHQGRLLSGLLAEETATGLKLRRAEGAEDNLLRSEIAELRASGRSLMPEGLEQVLDPQAVADLIVFLRRGEAPPLP